MMTDGTKLLPVPVLTKFYEIIDHNESALYS